MDATEKLVDDILNDRVEIKQLDIEQMRAVIDFMRENIETMVSDVDDDEADEYAEGLRILVDLIEDATERRFEEEHGSEWEQTIDASIARGNTYFELENYVLQ